MKRLSPQTFKLSGRGLTRVLGSLEAAVMEEMWRQGETTIRGVWLNLRAHRVLAFNTIMTVMNRLARKGILIRRGRSGQYRFLARESRDEFMARTSRMVADGLVRDFGEFAISQFVAAVHQLDPRRLDALRQAVIKAQSIGGDYSRKR